MADDWWRNWSLELDSGVPVYRQIVDRIATAFAVGQLKPGDRLPTIRCLHQHLRVNPNTVAKAYRELELKGLLVGERGNGSYMNAEATPQPPSEAEREAALASLYQRMLTEAAGRGLGEREVIEYIEKRKVNERAV